MPYFTREKMRIYKLVFRCPTTEENEKILKSLK